LFSDPSAPSNGAVAAAVTVSYIDAEATVWPVATLVHLVAVPEVWLVDVAAPISVIARSLPVLAIPRPVAGITIGLVAPVAVRAAGALVTFAVRVSPAANAELFAVPAVSDVTLIRIRAPIESVVTPVDETTVIDEVFSANDVATALAGATDVKTPKPNAATVTSATRLKVVFVDICFLSISRSREFPSFGFELIS